MRPALSVQVLYLTMGAHPVSPLFRIHSCIHLGMGGLGTRRSTCLVRTCWRCGTIHANSRSSLRAFPGSEPHCCSGKMALSTHRNQACRPTTDVPTKPVEHVSTVTDNELDDEIDTSRKLYDVVMQLQGDMREGSSQDAKMRNAIDSFFERLPDPSQSLRDPVKASVPLAYEGASSTSTSNRINVEENELRSNSPSNFGNARMAIYSNSSVESGTGREGGKPSPTLLTQGQDVPPQSSARVNNVSFNKLGETSFLSTLTARKFQIMRTRLESIRKGRVSWAVLPLLLRARDSGITMTTATYNSALAVYKATPNKYPDAMRVLEIMRSSESLYGRPDATSYNIVMRVCGDAGNWRTVFELLNQMKAEGIVPDAESRAVILNGVAKAKRWRHARRLFAEMNREGLPINEFGYNAMVEAAGLGSPSPHRHMAQFVVEMEQAGKMPTTYTYTVLLHCLALRRRYHDGFLVMVRLVDARVPLLPLGYHAALTFCKEHGDWRRAMALMEDMRVTNRRPSGEMYLLAVQACAKGGQWERALSLMVERRRNDAKEAAQAREAQAAAARADVKVNPGSRSRPVAQARAEELDMRSFEAVLEAVSLAGQFEVALRLLHQIRSARYTPSEACYMATIRAAAKWGRWDHVDGLLQDVDKLGVEAPVPKGRRGKTPMRQVPDAAVRRELGSECYAYLVKAYAQAMLWTHAIDVYREKLLPRWEEDGKEPLTYQVYAGVLEACMATSDGVTALQVIRRQVVEARGISEGERSGGPPDRRCWCLAAEALGRAGMIDEGHALLRAMVLSGMPFRESTKADVPSLMPLPDLDDFEWRRRRLRRSRRSRSRAQPGRRRDADAALRQFVQSVPDLAGDARNGTRVDHRAVGELFRDSGKGGQVGLGEVLMRDWEQKHHFLAECRTSGDISWRLERKRKRMKQFCSRDERREEGRQQLLPKKRLGRNALPRGRMIVQGDANNRTPRLGGREAFPIDSALERRRGRDESLPLRMYFPRTPGILKRRNRTREQDRVALGRQANPSCGGKV